MPHALNLDDVRIAAKFVNDTIIADADAVSSLRTSEFLRAVRQWIVCQLGYTVDDARNIIRRNGA